MTYELVGRLMGASNATFLVADDDGERWVYKPVVGERPLWDFPEGTLGLREVMAYEVSEALGLGVVPETIWDSGPFEEGSFQRFIDGRVSDAVDLIAVEDMSDDWLAVTTDLDAEHRPVVLVHRDDPRLRRMALFDAIINNADRKAGHIIDFDGRLYGVDHGVSFNVDDKLRTVLWGFMHEPFDGDERAILAEAAALQPLLPGLHDDEWAALRRRAAALLEQGEFPAPSADWPAIPWPPF